MPETENWKSFVPTGAVRHHGEDRNHLSPFKPEKAPGIAQVRDLMDWLQESVLELPAYYVVPGFVSLFEYPTGGILILDVLIVCDYHIHRPSKIKRKTQIGSRKLYEIGYH